MRKFSLLISAPIAVIIVTLILANRSEDVRYVKTEILETSTIRNHINCSGQLNAYRFRSLGVSGYAVVDKIYVNIGDTVEQGQILLTYSAAENASSDAVSKILNGADLDISDAAKYINFANSFEIENEGYITAPFSGVITDIAPKEGEQLSPLSAAVQISDNARMTVTLRVYENDLGKVTVGMPVTLSGGTFEDVRHGVITAVSPSIKSSTSLTGVTERYGEVTAELNECDGLLNGASVDAQILTSEVIGAILVPYTAVSQDDNGNEYVYVLSSNRALKRIITTAEDLGNQVRVSNGLRAGECLIIESPDTIFDGETVLSNAHQ